MDQHYILCGLGNVGWRILEHLRAAGTAVVVVDTACAPDDPRLTGATLVTGDFRKPEVLERAGLATAKGILIVTSDDLVNLSAVLLIRNLNPTVRVVVRLFNQNLLARLGSALTNVHALSTSGLAGPLMALIARTGEALGTFRLADGSRQQIVDVPLAPTSRLIGQCIAAVARDHNVAVVAHQQANHEPRFASEVPEDIPLKAGDQIVLSGPPLQLAPLIAGGGDESIQDLLWAGKVRRFWRVMARSVAMIDLPVKVCTIIFLAVILVSTLVFHYSIEKDARSIIDAFYRTISLMATGADMRGDEVPPGTWQKGVISGLRLVGTALTAAFTAIFTNYLIRANLGGALEVRRIPDGGHIIVCGLGNVGFRVVEELVNQGEPVVALERNRDNPFITTARRLGVAVILGDATVAEVLKQSHAALAHAVVAATSNDLANLEIALLVRELNPRQRVVVRLTDPGLAKTLRQAASIRLALSIPELAAPAFVAALFGDRVRSIFMAHGLLLSVFDLVIRKEDVQLLNMTLREVTESFHSVALQRLSADGTRGPLVPADRLHPGDSLTLIAKLRDLQRIMQHT